MKWEHIKENFTAPRNTGGMEKAAQEKEEGRVEEPTKEGWGGLLKKMIFDFI